MTGIAFHFQSIRHQVDLAQFLECTVDDLDTFADTSRQREFYDELRIPKRRRRGHRIVYRARDAVLLRMHKTLAEAVSGVVRFPPCVQGFVKKRSIVTNASQHLGRPMLLHADIKHFFESIKLPAVVSCFELLGCRPGVANLLGRLCTRDGVLPQGAHPSPVLANLACRQLDADLEMLAAAHRCTYTRYADDITFSGDEVPSEEIIKDLLGKQGFELRDGRCRLQRRGRGQFVTGLSVADIRGPRLPRKLKRRLRLVLHYASLYGMKDHLRHVGRGLSDPEQEFWKIEGQTRFLSSVETQTAWTMRQQLMQVRARMIDDRLRDMSGEEESS